jgi:TPR repeat protein
VIAGISSMQKAPPYGGAFCLLNLSPSSWLRFGRVVAMSSRRDLLLSIAFSCICLLPQVHPVLANAQAPFVKTQNGVSPAKETLWATMHEPLSDADIAKVNLELFAKGDEKAAYELGLAYMQGLGVPQDFAKAEQMFQIGAVDPEQKAMVGMFYAHGYFPKNLDAVERWYSAAGRPQDYFELAEAFKADGQIDKSSATHDYSKAAAIYLSLLKEIGHPEVRRAEFELGNFVIDGFYSAGNDAQGRAQNLEWARMIAQILLGEKEYQSAVEYELGNNDLPVNKAMWLRYCERAAAYDVDNAQHFYVEALNDGSAHDFTGYDAITWTRLNSEKMYADNSLLKAMTSSMTPQQMASADAAYQELIKTRSEYGAYYVQDDPLRDPSPAALEAMDQDDPDVQLREAFGMERLAVNDEVAYQNALAIYRKVRDHRDFDFRFVLGRYALNGTNGSPQNRAVAEYWLNEAARSGSQQAQQLLNQIRAHP